MTQALKILVCDDSALVRKKLTSVLEQLGYSDIREAEHGDAAVAAVAADPPHIVFMDIVMPEKDGIQALREIREINRSVKVVMASSVGTHTKVLEALKLGAYDFVQKPFAPETIRPILTRLQAEGGQS